MAQVTRPVLPGGTIGVLGGGQLGRMLALSARRAGYRLHVLTDSAESPAAQVADRHVVASYDDVDAVVEFASGVDVITIEFENVSSVALEAAGRITPARPSAGALHVSQNRLREKEFLRANGFAHARFVAVSDAAVLQELAPSWFPFVAKSAGFGYDGKGQAVVAGPDGLPAAEALLTGGPIVLEERVELQAELSVVAARSASGRVVSYPPFINHHREGVLDTTLFPWPSGDAPMGLPAGATWPRLVAEAQDAAAEVLALLDFVGVACVEFFVTDGDELLVNEIAPRPHNSGHLTIEACSMSQFELQWRAVCGLPLGSVRPLAPAAMVNLLGDVWNAGEPRWERALEQGGVSLHLYGKAEPRQGRKMGHLTAVAGTLEEAERAALAARASLART